MNFLFIHEVYVTYAPQQNRVTERKNRTLVDMINSILCSSSLLNLWGKALILVSHLKQDKCEKILYELWKDKRLNLTNFKAWGVLLK